MPPPPKRAVPPARASASVGDSSSDAQKSASTSFLNLVMGWPRIWNGCRICRVAPPPMQARRDHSNSCSGAGGRPRRRSGAPWMLHFCREQLAEVLVELRDRVGISAEEREVPVDGFDRA